MGNEPGEIEDGPWQKGHCRREDPQRVWSDCGRGGDRSTQGSESPELLKLSLAAAMTLGFEKGLFHRGARLFCANLLLTYADGCRGRCAYCGLSSNRAADPRGRTFIRVRWPAYPLEEILERLKARQDRLHRVCISMVTHARASRDAREICEKVRSRTDLPVSILVGPTVLRPGDLEAFRDAGADKIGVAIDLATAPLFEKYRGRGVAGPHRWETYWKCLEEALSVFGAGNGGAHFIVGMGETEKDMCRSIQAVRDMGGSTHLFSFYPEAGSLLQDRSPPPLAVYRRIQLARYLIDKRMAREESFAYGPKGQISDFGIAQELVDRIVSSGEPFRTSGCTGADGQVACNRPYGNSRPGEEIRNYPFPPTPEDLARIRVQLKGWMSAHRVAY